MAHRRNRIVTGTLACANQPPQLTGAAHAHHQINFLQVGPPPKPSAQRQFPAGISTPR